MSILTEFHEGRYLAANPDVSAAVKGGLFSSGLEHFLIHGMTEARPGVETAVDNAIRSLCRAAESARPPPELRRRVHGDEDAVAFESTGRLTAFYIVEKLLKELGSLPLPRVLDFGCGCGRVAKYTKQITPISELHCVDVDKDAITWSRSNLQNFAVFEVNTTTPPLHYADCTFDAVYSISVFTHLPEKMQFLWLEELRRITKPGGCVVITTHGRDLLLKYAQTGLEAFEARGFYYQTLSRAEGLPCYYQTSYHSHAYLKREWSKYFTVQSIVPEGLMRHQDIVVLRRPPIE